MDDNRLLELHASGLSFSKIAAALGCSRPAVSLRAKKLGLVANQAVKPIDISLLRQETLNGVSFSEFARRHQHTLPAVSRAAKKWNIKPPGDSHIRKELPDQQILAAYRSGESLDALRRHYGVSVQTIRRHLLAADPGIVIRSLDEAKRPPELNDSRILAELMNKHSLRAIAKRLEVRTATVQSAARRLGLYDMIRHKEVTIATDDLIRMYEIERWSITRIASAIDASPATIARKLKAQGIHARPAHGMPKPSSFEQLNDGPWLQEQYIGRHRSMASIAAEVGTTLGNVKHHLLKHGVQLRSKREVHSDLRIRQSLPDVVQTKWGDFRVSSKLERRFLNWLEPSVTSVRREPITLTHQGHHYVPDFGVDDELVEVKPAEWMRAAGVDRQKFLKQSLVAAATGYTVKYWDGDYYTPEPVNDEDRYFVSDWRLLFSSPDEVFDFYQTAGFKPLKWPRMALLQGIRWIVPNQYKFDATFNCTNPVKILKHFNEHYWYSAHARYNPIVNAFGAGNRNVLKGAIEAVWGYKRNVNVYALVNAIKRYFKDFLEPSLFKPWIAQAVYDRLLPNGGTVFDPCIGWGGRLLGTVDRDIAYIGSDLNQLSVIGSTGIAELVGAAFAYDPILQVADARDTDVPSEADLVFTSPPYDDTERYHGLPQQCEDTTAIYRNIFHKARCPVALNVPLRHADLVTNLAVENGYQLTEELAMKNRTLITRESTYEPILIFRR